MRKIFPAAFPLVLSLVLIPACGKGLKKDIPGPNDKVYNVSVAEVVSKNIPDGIEIPGVFTVTQKLTVKSDFTGKVQALSVIEGQQVSINDALLKIEDEKLTYVIDRQHAELREAEAQLELDTSKSNNAIPEENPEENSDAASEDSFVSPNNPNNPSNNEDNVTPENPDATPNAATAPNQEPTESTPFPGRRPFGMRRPFRRPGLPARPANIPLPPNPELNENRISLDQAKIDRIKTELAISERQLAGSTVLTSVDGFVAKINVAEGSMVKPDDILLEIVKIDPIEFSVQIPKEEISRLNKSMEAKVTANNFGQEIFSGQVSYIGAEVDAAKKSLELRVRIPNPGMRLKAGMDGIAHLAIANKTHPALL
ncbi:MAG: efflux RND transporter periplasmic adaptor subunit, partial [Deltaproteobacteria bacterium]|nr:efflux RND transporter periplasmic adaptor subunit [Deltaproteobacteria bacterium]